MQLIGLAVVLTLSLVLAPVAAGAEQAGKIPRLCFLTFDSRMTPSNRLSSSRASPVQFDPFFQRLHDLGYVDGLTITIDYLSADGQGERFPALAADCLRLKADMIVVTTTPAAQAAKNATPHDPNRHVSTWRPCGDRARRKPRLIVVALRGHNFKSHPRATIFNSLATTNAGWRATFYTSGMEHSPTSATGTGRQCCAR